ncbi:hypothetical protein B0G84_7555 [Paraburkholderia sp. BL8N3]|nr:hypothetical protein [Paraburkholderia sp. BL8N3]TCK33344.1 hypothetical protein B0G84_7555 [Paraburkholderia sp. BL8N3]
MPKVVNDVTFDWEWQHMLCQAKEKTPGKPVGQYLAPAVTYENGYYGVASENVKFIATVTATSSSNLSRYQVGFSQTVYSSNRACFYFSSQRTKTVEILPQPAWDGDEDDTAPWYGSAQEGSPIDYDEDDNQWMVILDDSPVFMHLSVSPKAELRNAHFGWETDPRSISEGKTLFYIEGHDSFTTFLCVYDTEAKSITVLDYVPWYVTYGQFIDPVRKQWKTVPGSGTVVGAHGVGFTGNPKLDGLSAEAYNRSYFLEWAPENLPAQARKWLKFKV